MAKRKKSDAARLDEVGRTMHSTFCGAANSLSQIYAQAVGQQKAAFQAGERHGLEKLYQWISKQHGEGSRVVIADIVGYLQNEIDYAEDISLSPRLQYPYQHAQSAQHFTNITTSNLSGISGVGDNSFHVDQVKNSIFVNALSSPVRHDLLPYHLAQCRGHNLISVSPSGNGTENHDTSSDTPAMDMQSDHL